MRLTKTKYINIAIMFALTFIIATLPGFGKITPFGMKVLAVFISVLYGWITVDLLVPSIWGFAALGLFGLTPTANALSIGLGNTQVVVILAAMAFIGALDEVGVTKAIANWMLTRNIVRKSPWILVIGMVITAYVLGLVGASIAGMLLLWQVVGDIAQKNNIAKGDGLVSFTLMMITAAAFSGMFALPFHATTMIFTGYFIQAVGHGLDVIPFIVSANIVFILVLALMIILGKFVFRFDANQFTMADEIVTQMKNEKVTTGAKIGMVTLAVFICSIILPALFESMPGAQILNSLGIGGMSILGMIVLAIVSTEKEKGLVHLAKVWTRYTDWSLILLLAVTFPIAELMRAADAGIMPTIVGIVLPIVSKMGITKFIIAICIFLGILTQVTHNIVLAAMFVPFLVPLCQQMGGNISTMFMLVFIALNASYVTPAASFQSAMVHGLDRMSTKWAYILGTAFLIITWIVLFTVGMPVCNALFA